MKATSERTVAITIAMNEREARWLMAIMQNYMGGEQYAEGIDEKNMRENFFCTLRDKLED